MTSRTTITCDCCGGTTGGLTLPVTVGRAVDPHTRELHICHVCFTPIVAGAHHGPDVDASALGRAVLGAARAYAKR